LNEGEAVLGLKHEKRGLTRAKSYRQNRP
jgi:hypothetical protein